MVSYLTFLSYLIKHKGPWEHHSCTLIQSVIRPIRLELQHNGAEWRSRRCVAESGTHITPPSAERASAIHSFPFGTGPVNEMCTLPGAGAVSTWPAASLSTFAFRSAALVRSSTSMVIAKEALEKREVTVMVCFFLEEGTCGVPPMTPVVIGIERPRGRGGAMANHTRSKVALVPAWETGWLRPRPARGRSGGCSQRQSTPQATPSSGPPRPTRRFGRIMLAG